MANDNINSINKVEGFSIQNKSATIGDRITEPFGHIVDLITSDRQNALRKVNEELIMLYFNVGKYLKWLNIKQS